MARTQGRAPRGERLRMVLTHGHWKTATLVARLSLKGIVAPMVLYRAINGVWFQDYVEQVLLPVLSPGGIVVMDNPGSHKGRRVREMIEAAGADLRFLPPYSPEFNPIENAFLSSRRPPPEPLSAPLPARGTASAKSSIS